MTSGRSTVPLPDNEPVLGYLPGSPERAALRAELARQKALDLDVPLVVGGREVRTGRTVDCRCPHDHARRLGRFHAAGAAEAELAVAAALEARAAWAATPWEARVAVFLKAAELLAGRLRPVLVAATMLGQGKDVYQAELDAACELVDFLRFNAWYAQRIYEEQPRSSRGVWNRVEQRPLEGFVFAATPFNFTSIAANLPAAPALMGNTVLWKPASSAVWSAWFTVKLLEEAGLPPGVLNFVPGDGAAVAAVVLDSPDLAGIHFTGSTATFRSLWRGVAERLPRYRSYPRVVGETGGKDFVFVHSSADLDEVAVALVRGAFEYQGQKCSAASRAYVPDELWPRLAERLRAEVAALRMGDVEDFSCMVNAVIDGPAFERVRGYLDRARSSPAVEVLVGGGADERHGWFVEPTVLRTADPRSPTMVEEVFGPVLTVYVYPASAYEETLDLCDQTSPYALTGAVFARDRRAIEVASQRLLHAAGNFYVNDKPTGAVVGQQPFGGARASGTNDKAGSSLNLLRWVSPRTVKENFAPPRRVAYPHQDPARGRE